MCLVRLIVKLSTITLIVFICRRFDVISDNIIIDARRAAHPDGDLERIKPNGI